jgi:surface protein
MESMFFSNTVFNQDIGSWDVSNVANMNNMFWFADAFNQDLTQWCVSNISTIPDYFSAESGLAAGNHPLWGTCP